GAVRTSGVSGQPKPGLSRQRYRPGSVLRGAGRAARTPAGQPDRLVWLILANASVLRRASPGRQRRGQPDASLPRPVQQPLAATDAAHLAEVPLSRALHQRRMRSLLGAAVFVDRLARRN